MSIPTRLVILFLLPLPIYAHVFDVTDYGATANDGTNDLPAIQDAIQKAGEGDIVTFPEGIFTINNAIMPRSGIVIKGEGDGTIIQSSGNSGHVMVSLSGLSNVEITALTLEGKNNANVQQGITASQGSGHFIHHIAIKNLVAGSGFGPHGIYFQRDVTHSRIEDNDISYIGLASKWGAGMRISRQSSHNRILRNALSHTGRGGILCDRHSLNLIIQENTVVGSGGEGLGIEVWGGCANALIEDNQVDHWLSIDASDGSAIRRNTISDKSGIFKGHGLELVSSMNCLFTDNILDDGSAIGISISNDGPKNYIYWGYNTIRTCNTWGIQVQGDAGGASFQYFYKNKFLNTYSAHPKALYKNQGHGFRFNGNCHYITLDDNEIIDNGGAGIQFSGSDINHLSFVNNTITGNRGSVITDTPGDNFEWRNNTVSGNGNNTEPATKGFSNQRPTAAFSCEERVLRGEAVSFTNTSSDPDGSISHVLWDFGQGLPSNTEHPTYTFGETGTYRVSLLVWDNKGRGALAEKEVKVVNALSIEK